MSYCRFDEGDLYIYPSGANSIICTGCGAGDKDFVTTSHSKMLEHIIQHLKKGASVPIYAAQRLFREMDDGVEKEKLVTKFSKFYPGWFLPPYKGKD